MGCSTTNPEDLSRVPVFVRALLHMMREADVQSLGALWGDGNVASPSNIRDTAARWLADVVPFLPSRGDITSTENDVDSHFTNDPSRIQLTTNAANAAIYDNVVDNSVINGDDAVGPSNGVTVTTQTDADNYMSNGAVNVATNSDVESGHNGNVLPTTMNNEVEGGQTGDIPHAINGDVENGHPGGVITADNVVTSGGADLIGSVWDDGLAAIFANDGDLTADFIRDEHAEHGRGILNVNILESGNNDPMIPEENDDNNTTLWDGQLDAVFTTDISNAGGIVTDARGVRSSTPLNNSDVVSAHSSGEPRAC